jgi:hypothetical protein
MKNKLQRLDDAEQGIIMTIEPILPSLKKALSNVHMESGILSIFMTNIEEHPKDKREAVIVIERFIGETKKEINVLRTFINKNEKKITNNIVQGELIDDTIENINGIVMFSSDLLSSIFMDYESMPRAKKVHMMEAVRTYTNIYKAFRNGDVLDDIKNVTAGVSKEMVQGFNDKKSITFVQGFNGNPFYIFGKYMARMRQRRNILLNARIKYLRLEIMGLEMKDDKRLQKEIETYRQDILDMEMEIDELSKKYE